MGMGLCVGIIIKMRLHGGVATYTINYIIRTYKVLIIVVRESTFLRCFCFYFSVCRIHVTLDNFTIWCTAIFSANPTCAIPFFSCTCRDPVEML